MTSCWLEDHHHVLCNVVGITGLWTYMYVYHWIIWLKGHTAQHKEWENKK